MNVREAIEATIDYLTADFIVEECAESPADGCLSCEMIKVRASLRKAIEFMEYEDSTPLAPTA